MLIRQPKKSKMQGEKEATGEIMLENHFSLHRWKINNSFQNSNSEASSSSVLVSWVCFLPWEKSRA